MRRSKLLLIGILAFVTANGSTAYVMAKPTEASILPRHQDFSLRVKASLHRPNCKGPTAVSATAGCDRSPAPIIFLGPGKARATHKDVSVKFDVLTSRGERGKAVVRLRNPMRYCRGRNFHGHGVAIVHLPNQRLKFRVRVSGTMKRTSRGTSIMIGRFGSVSSSSKGAKLRGKFSGSSRPIPIPILTDRKAD